jgi:ribulose-bisphosphate carboxylase large chain
MKIMPDDRFAATYRIQTSLPPQQAAEVLAGEQSSGTFVAVANETPELSARHRARVESIRETDVAETPALPGARGGGPFRSAELRISWPVHNVGANLPTLMSTVAGNLFELSQFSGVKLMSIELPDSFTRSFRGPAFGVDGSRRLMGVFDRPMIGTIIKPSVGMSPEQTAAVVEQLVGAGVDFLKDDELMANPPHSPINRRIDAVMDVINRLADKTGRRAMFAFNVTDDLDAMQRHYDRIVARGGTCAMLSLNSVGLAATKKLCDRRHLAIHGHRNGWGMMNRHPMLGIEFPAYQVFWRLAGVDHLHVNGIANKFWESDDSVVRSIESCLAPMNGQRVLPVVSSGQTGLQAPETFRRTKTIDVLYNAGGGIMAHPSGPAAGVAALRQAWGAAVAGIPLVDHARTHVELRQSIERFGGKS